MKAVVFDQFGPPEQTLEVRDVPEPIPGPGEVKIRMIASPVNPSDLLYIAGEYGMKPEQFPATPGFEGVGVVVENGGGLLGWHRQGKRVAVLNDRVGNWSEYTVASAKQIIPIPDSVSDEVAAGYFVNPATAIALTMRVNTIVAGDWLLQSAAGSSLGKMIVALAKRQGIRTINVVRRAEQIDELKALGADGVVLESDGIEESVRRITGGAGVKFAIDPVGGSTGASLIRSLAPGGVCHLYGLLSGEPVSVDPRSLITGSKSVRGFWLADWMKSLSLIQKWQLVGEIGRLLRDGILPASSGASYPLERVREAVAEAARPGKPGKVLLRFKAES